MQLYRPALHTMTQSLSSRLLVLTMISLMVFLQTFIFMMSITKKESGSEEMVGAAVVTDLGWTLPFLKDPQTVKYISTQMQVIFFLRVVPDRGEPDLAKAIFETYKNSVVCCANNSRGVQKSSTLSCQDQIKDSCKKGIRVIIVNSTDNDPRDLRDYFTIAHDYNYTTVVVQPNATSSYDGGQSPTPDHKQGTSKNDDSESPSPPKVLYPFFYGWFLGFNVSLETQRAGRRIFGECVRQPKFVEIFKKYAIPGSPRNSSGSLDFDHYFSLEGFITGTTMLHCTSFFSNYSERAGSQQYATSPAVRQETGRAYTLTVIGFLITPRAFGARLRLSNEELLLWAKDGSTAGGGFVQVSGASNADRTMQQKNHQLDLKPEMTSPEKFTVDVTENSEVKCPKNWRPTKFSPTCGFGSQAHLTLGTGKGVEAVQTGFDLDTIIRKELEAVEKGEPVLTLPLPSGTARCYGEGNWAVYMDKPLEFGAVFSAWY